MALIPTYQSATRRRELRRRVRNALGPSSHEAPEARATIDAQQALAELVQLATGGAITVRLVYRDGCDHLPIDYAQARQLIKGEPVAIAQDPVR